RLQHAAENNSGKRIVIIPHYLGNAHWTGIIIEFRETNEIQLVEFIDPVTNSSFLLNKIQQEFNELYSAVTISPITLETCSDSTQSEELTLHNLLKRVEQLELMHKQYKKLDDRTSTIHDNLSKSQQDASSTYGPSSLSDCKSKHKSDVDCKSNPSVSTADLLIPPSQTEQQIEQVHTSSNSKDNFPDESSQQTVDEKSKAAFSAAQQTADRCELESCESLENQLNNGFCDLEISDEAELKEDIIQVKQEINDLEKRGKPKTAETKRKFLSKLEDLRTLAEKVKTLKAQPSSDENEENLKSKLAGGFAEHEIKDETELEDEIIKVNQEINDLEKRGKPKAAQEKRTRLSKLEDLEMLV
ncbi:unnamed protein product, partial [Rotaria sp. Silwood1]